MTVSVAKGRRCLDNLGDNLAMGSKQKKGFRVHGAFFGSILFLLGRAFKDKDAGWVNTESARKYLGRVHLSLEADTSRKIQQLNPHPSAEKVRAIFLVAKSCQVSPKRAIPLMNDTTYPIYSTKFSSQGSAFILLEKQDQGVNSSFYEMLWEQGDQAVLLTSSTAPGNPCGWSDTFRKGGYAFKRSDVGQSVSNDQFDYLYAERTEEEKLKLCHLFPQETREINVRIIDGFKIDHNGLVRARGLMKTFEGRRIVLNADCKVGLAFVIFMSLFEEIEKGRLKVEEVTLTHVHKLAARLEIDITYQLDEEGYTTNKMLQEAIQQVLDLGENR